jgi:NAD-dependent dihydropyrimidine dehydrogenase PreA subunit
MGLFYMNDTCVIFCNCGAGVISKEKSEQILADVKLLNADLFQMHDFCGVALNRKDFIREIERKYSRKIMIACYSRAIKSMLTQNNLELSGLEVLNFKELSATQIGYRLRTDFSLQEGTSNEQMIESGLDVPAWYPVVDQPLCSDCGKCFKFCLFGVYTFSNKKLQVVKPLGCKNNCPACGRNCPTSAIIFPRLMENSVLAGAEPGTEMKPKGLAADINMIATLNQRSALRRNIFRAGLVEQAEAERRKALEEATPDLPQGEEKERKPI